MFTNSLGQILGLARWFVAEIKKIVPKTCSILVQLFESMPL